MNNIEYIKEIEREVKAVAKERNMSKEEEVLKRIKISIKEILKDINKDEKEDLMKNSGV